jgi:hypothetical protein
VAQNVHGRRRAGREDANKEGGAFAISIAPAHQQQNVVNSSDGVVARRPAHMRLNSFEPQFFFLCIFRSLTCPMDENLSKEVFPPPLSHLFFLYFFFSLEMKHFFKKPYNSEI